MRLQRVRVENYRSIVDSGVVNIEDVVTVLIGKNEQGKTNFLKALASFNEQVQYSPGDLPNHLRPQLDDRNPGEIPIVSLWMVPEPSDLIKLKEVLLVERVADQYKATRYFDGHYEYFAIASEDVDGSLLTFPSPDITPVLERLFVKAEDLRNKLKVHSERSEEFAKGMNQVNQHVESFKTADFGEQSQIENVVKTFATALKALPGQDKPIQNDIAAAIESVQAEVVAIYKALSTDPLAGFKAIIPSFVFHSSSLDRIPKEVMVSEFVANPEGTSKGMANLCAVAGLSAQKIQQLAAAADTSKREAYEDHYRASVSGGINEFWTQAKYEIHFRIEKDRLSVSVSDNRYSPRIAPTERSDGFQWYLSFYSALLNEASTTSNVVAVLDNPALELHPDGQRDIKRFLEEKLPSLTQVIYVTHSPAMIDSFNLEQLRIVERGGKEEGTKVSNWVFKEGRDADLLEPVRSAIGASLVTSLMFSDFNVLVEGAADKPILEGAFAALQEQDARRVLINGSVAESKDGFLPRFYERSGLPFVVLADGDAGGRKLVRDLKRWGIPDSKIIDLKKVFPDRADHDFELEDILGYSFYDLAVSETYPNERVAAPAEVTGKITKAYEQAYTDHFQFGFNKRRVGETIKKLLVHGKGDRETLDNLKKLTARIVECCEAQTTARSSKDEPKPEPEVAVRG